MIEEIFSLRERFIIIGLTGLTGSGCTTVAKRLSTTDSSKLLSNYRNDYNKPFDNQYRKDRIVRHFIDKVWKPFTVITASDIIYYFAFLLPYKDFIREIAKTWEQGEKEKSNVVVKELAEAKQALLKQIREAEEYNILHDRLVELDTLLENQEYDKVVDGPYRELLFELLPQYRRKVEELITHSEPGLLTYMLQTWGNNLRKYGSITKGEFISPKAPTTLVRKINRIVKCIRKDNDRKGEDTRIVIDSLRNPFEIMFLRERYSAFYCMSVNISEEERRKNLQEFKDFRQSEINSLNNSEGSKDDVKESYRNIDVVRCIQLSDIFIFNKHGKDHDRMLNNQILTYVALILHPGLVPPTPEERIMQIAFTAKLSSGCLSRQVGAVVTDANFSVKAVGWNAAPEGQVPCTLRRMDDFVVSEDEEAFSEYEKENTEFQDTVNRLYDKYIEVIDDALDEDLAKDDKGIAEPLADDVASEPDLSADSEMEDSQIPAPEKEKESPDTQRRMGKLLNTRVLRYCFKDIYTGLKGDKNQVHTRSLHAEENAFLQLVKYGNQGIQGGKLFTTASCCELCAKKAYHLGIREIYYIDPYPGISYDHIFKSGAEDHRPEIKLFYGAVGRAYINLYSPFIPQKDDIAWLADFSVKNFIKNEVKS